MPRGGRRGNGGGGLILVLIFVGIALYYLFLGIFNLIMVLFKCKPCCHPAFECCCYKDKTSEVVQKPPAFEPEMTAIEIIGHDGKPVTVYTRGELAPETAAAISSAAAPNSQPFPFTSASYGDHPPGGYDERPYSYNGTMDPSKGYTDAPPAYTPAYDASAVPDLASMPSVGPSAPGLEVAVSPVSPCPSYSTNAAASSPFSGAALVPQDCRPYSSQPRAYSPAAGAPFSPQHCPPQQQPCGDSTTLYTAGPPMVGGYDASPGYGAPAPPPPPVLNFQGGAPAPPGYDGRPPYGSGYGSGGTAPPEAQPIADPPSQPYHPYGGGQVFM